jgi:hypothetical protein
LTKARRNRFAFGSAAGQKKAAVIAYRCWSVAHTVRSNSLIDLFIQQL